MSAVLAVFRIEVSNRFFFCLDALLATSHISEGFRPETGIYYVAQPSRRTHHQFVLRGQMTSICHNETVSRQNL